MFGAATAAGSAGLGSGAGHGRLPRLEARVRRGQIDRALWDGADPAQDRALRVRARQLTRRRRRERCARRLERADARLEQGLVMQLVLRLGDDRPISARGMLRLDRLLADGNGPLFRPRQPGELRAALRQARTDLDG